ncbi:MAG: redox-sensing transcriptional repressor Rex, partial [Oscillospiraceae bacterium]
GNLGHALIENFGFKEQGFNLVAAFDSSPSIAGTVIAGVPVYDSEKLSEWLLENKTDIVVLTVPKRIAKQMAVMVTDCGVRGIWNFTNIELELGRPDVHVENIHFSDSLLTLGYYLTEPRAEEQKKPHKDA